MKYAIIFDMDETLGFFQQINYLWHSLKKINYNYYGSTLNNNYFSKILDLYPEFIRPNLVLILNYLKNKKIENKCSSVIIFTNNQTSKEWVTLIQNYFNEKIDYNLFDKIICAYKINEKIIEENRNHESKTFDDFIQCTRLDPRTNLLFLDDKYYPKMNKNNLMYIKIRQFTYTFEKDILLNRLINSDIVKNNLIQKNIVINFINNYNYRNKYINEDINIHKILSKKILQHLNKFFSHYKTLKMKIYNKNTRKNNKSVY